MKNLNFIDIVKYIMSLLVVTIHCYVVDVVDNHWLHHFFNTILRTAVPFFFITSGFLLFRTANFDSNGLLVNHDIFIIKLRKQVKRIFILYLLWYFIYLFKWINFSDEIIPQISSKLYGLFFSGGWHLWYLWSMIIVLPVLAILLKKKVKVIQLLAISIFLFFAYRFYSHFGDVESPNWWQLPLSIVWKGKYLNLFGLMDAFLYLSIGAYICYDERVLSLSKGKLLILLLAGLLVGEFDNGEVSIANIPVAFSIFVLSVQCNKKLNDKLCKSLRTMSTFIYLSHIYIISFVGTYISNDKVALWIVSVVISVSVGLLFFCAQRKVSVFRKFI